MIRAAIIGGSGYTAGELIRLLINHPDVEISWIQSETNAGKRIDEIHQGLIGEIGDKTFTSETPLEDADVIFFCTPHGKTKEWMSQNSERIPEHLRIIDLSTDYRIEDGTHEFIYGLPEINRKRIVREGKYIANPGCFATAIQLALLPLAKNLLLNEDINVTAITGSTGAGIKPSATTHFSWRNDNVSIYKPFTHQHLNEIRQTLSTLQQSFSHDINFIPMRGPFSRGILAVVYMTTKMKEGDIIKLYEDYYDDHNFTFISDKSVDLKDVVNTNKCLIHIEKIGDKLLITSAIDNLLKGASGTAVHNMNLLFGLHERIGLKLKATGF